MNSSRAGLMIVVLITPSRRGLPWYVELDAEQTVSVRRATRRARASSRSQSTVSYTALVTFPSRRCTGSEPRYAPFSISDGSFTARTT
ncbi:MAG: hypothetical protein M3291_01330 [Actinomycetota bacterium]|nr:hypothetical protein [Actinomycetota bacterium]